jgi:nitronate monooxygenase
MENTLSDTTLFSRRERNCDLGYLRQAYRKLDATVGYRCSAEPVEDFLNKGGDLSETPGRKCVCNGLLATVGLGRVRSGHEPEPALITAGNDVAQLAQFLKPNRDSYTAAEVIDYLCATASETCTAKNQSNAPQNAVI